MLLARCTCMDGGLLSLHSASRVHAYERGRLDGRLEYCLCVDTLLSCVCVTRNTLLTSPAAPPTLLCCCCPHNVVAAPVLCLCLSCTQLHVFIEKLNTNISHLETCSREMLQQADMSAAAVETFCTSITHAELGLQQVCCV